MAMRKEEMAEASEQYAALLGAARACIRAGLFREALKNAAAACDHIDGMLQYARKYEDREFDTIEALDLILAYAPLLLDYRKLDFVEEKLKNCRRIEREMNADLRARLSAARKLLWDAHRLWSYLEENPGCRECDLKAASSATPNDWARIIAAWREMELVRCAREGDTVRFSLTTRMAELVRGKCSRCGEGTEAPKAIFLSPLSCPSCSAPSWFVILPGALGEA